MVVAGGGYWWCLVGIGWTGLWDEGCGIRVFLGVGVGVAVVR